jgi:hypothetical protein
MPETSNTGAITRSGVRSRFVPRGIRPLRRPWKISSERTQQDRAYESKHGHHRQHVQFQGKFHVVLLAR